MGSHRQLSLALTVCAAATLLLSAPAPAGATASNPHAVVALVDSGINPYHEVFRDRSPLARRHPSTYLPGFPSDAQALRLTFDAPSYWAAVRADCKRVWSKIEPGRFYWFPGTKIVGGITFGEQSQIPCGTRRPSDSGRIIDTHGHGTMVASRAASTQYGACRDCRVVAVQHSGSFPYVDPSPAVARTIQAIRWIAKNSSWVDAQSISWAPLFPLWRPNGNGGSHSDLALAIEDASRRHLSFWAAGNSAGLGRPTLTFTHFTPSALIVGGHDSGYMNTWPGFSPHLVSDSCDSWAAYHRTLDKSGARVGGGTSGATPFAAGGAARILLEARRLLGDSQTGADKGVVAEGRKSRIKSGPLKDDKLTLREWRGVLLKTASERPERHFEDGPVCDVDSLQSPTPVKWRDVPEAYPEYVQIGYGAVDRDSFKLAAHVLSGSERLPNRAETDQYFAADGAAREAVYETITGP